MRMGTTEIFEAEYECCNECGELQLYRAQELRHQRGCEKTPEEQGCGNGWFYWYCSPGCLPDSEPFGPFESEQAAVNDATENSFIESED